MSRMIYSAIDGGIIMGRALLNPKILPEQILIVRSYLKMVLEPALATRRAA